MSVVGWRLIAGEHIATICVNAMVLNEVAYEGAVFRIPFASGVRT